MLGKLVVFKHGAALAAETYFVVVDESAMEFCFLLILKKEVSLSLSKFPLVDFLCCPFCNSVTCLSGLFLLIYHQCQGFSCFQILYRSFDGVLIFFSWIFVPAAKDVYIAAEMSGLVIVARYSNAPTVSLYFLLSESIFFLNLCLISGILVLCEYRRV